jgi:hypothetical protein
MGLGRRLGLAVAADLAGSLNLALMSRWFPGLEWREDPRVHELRRAMVSEYGGPYWDSEGYCFTLYPWRNGETVAIGLITLTSSLPLTPSLLRQVGPVDILAERFQLLIPPLFDSARFDYDPLPCVCIVSATAPGETQTRTTPRLLMPSDVTPGMICLVPLIERPKGWPP